MVGDARWLEPQTIHEGRGPALMEAGAKGRYAASLFGAWPYGTGRRATQGEAFVHLRHAPEGSLRVPERESANSLTPKSDQLSLAATRHAARGLRWCSSRSRFVSGEAKRAFKTSPAPNTGLNVILTPRLVHSIAPGTAEYRHPQARRWPTRVRLMRRAIHHSPVAQAQTAAACARSSASPPPLPHERARPCL
jgi:hypothetical protein